MIDGAPVFNSPYVLYFSPFHPHAYLYQGLKDPRNFCDQIQTILYDEGTPLGNRLIRLTAGSLFARYWDKKESSGLFLHAES